MAGDPTGQPDSARAGEGFVGRIPVRNLWLLMLYASDLFESVGAGHVGLEESPDKLPDLVAEILASLVAERLRRRLTPGYRPQHAVLNRVRGRIDVLATEERQLLARGLVACRFDEMSLDTVRNRHVCSALESVSRIVRNRELAHRCRDLAATMRRMGVSRVAPSRAELSMERFGRHDASDRQMVNAATLAKDLLLPTEAGNSHALMDPIREAAWARTLFEKAVGGFYAVTLRPNGWRVRRGQRIRWPIKQKTAGASKIMPGMQTDIVLEQGSARRLVIDTKFTSIVTAGWHREETLHSGYIYQMYAYLQSQSGCGSVLADNASGLLLHPAVGESVDEAVRMQGHTIRFATVNLAGTAAQIRNALLRVCEEIEWPLELIGKV